MVNDLWSVGLFFFGGGTVNRVEADNKLGRGKSAPKEMILFLLF